MKDIYKLELTTEEMSFFRLISMNSPNTPKGLVSKLLNAELYIPSYNKRLATKKATKVRSDRAKDKINNAIIDDDGEMIYISTEYKDQLK